MTNTSKSTKLFKNGITLAALKRHCRVDKYGCWVWKRHIKRGYSYLRLDHEGVRFNTAHRLAYYLVHGPIPGTLSIHHICANTKCCNPEHLQLLTMTENNSEMMERRRYRETIDILTKKVIRLEKENAKLLSKVEKNGNS